MIDTVDVTKKPSMASRYLFVLVAGLLLGIIATVMVLRAWQVRQDPFPSALMTVMAKQSGQLRVARQQSRCMTTDSLPHLQSLRALSNDLDAAFPALKDDERFQQHASTLRASLNDALSGPPSDCQALESVITGIGDGCEACHQDYK